MATMMAVMLDAPGRPDPLQIQDPPILTPGPEQVERGPEWHHLPHWNTGVVGRPATVGVAAQPIRTVC
jgi:hypothetical protein